MGCLWFVEKQAAHLGHGGEVVLVEAGQAAEPALDVDLLEAGGATVEAGDGFEVVEGPVHEIVLGGGDGDVVAEAAEAGAHECAAALGKVRPLARGERERLRVDVLRAGGHEDAGVLRQALVGGKPHAHHRGVGQLHSFQRPGCLRSDLFEQQRRSRGGHGEDDVVVGGVLAAFEAVLRALELDGGDERVDVDVRAGFLGERFVDLLVAVPEGLEHRTLAGGHLAAGALQVGHGGGQVDLAVCVCGGEAVELLGQLRDGRAHTEVVGGAGVHPAEQGGDDVVHHLVAVAFAHERAHVDVTADLPGESFAVGLGVDALGSVLADQVCDSLGRRRDAHHAAGGQPPRLAVHPHQGAQAGRFHQGAGKAELGEEVHGVLAPRHERLGAHVGGAGFKSDGVQFAAKPVGGLVDVDLQVVLCPGAGGARAAKFVRGGQARQAGTDDGDVH